MKKVLVITVKEIENDNRVINHANSLASMGNEVDLICIASRASSNASYKFRAIRLNLVSRFLPVFFLFNLVRIFEYLLRSFNIARRSAYEIIHANDLQGLVVGALIKRLIRRDLRIVYDAHEYETEVNGLKGFPKTVYKTMEKTFIKDISKFITVSDSIADEYKRLYQIANPCVILNVPTFKMNPVGKNDRFRERFGIRASQKIFLYQGYLMKGRGIETLLESFNSLGSVDNVIIFMGKGPLLDLVLSFQGSDNIFHHDFVSPQELAMYTSSADVGISFIEDISLSDRYCLPNKLFEYVFTGLPVITSNLPEMKRFVEINNLGIVAKDNTKEGFREAVNKMNKSDLGLFKANALLASSKYSWEIQEKKLHDLYNDL